MHFYQFLRFYLDWRIPKTFLFWYQMKARIWVGNRFAEKPICFGCGFELGKTNFELICQKWTFFFPSYFWVLGNNAFLVKPIYWIVFLDWALQWITKRNTFSGWCISFESEISAFEMVIFRFQITQLFGFLWYWWLMGAKVFVVFFYVYNLNSCPIFSNIFG